MIRLIQVRVVGPDTSLDVISLFTIANLDPHFDLQRLTCFIHKKVKLMAR